MLTIDRTVLHLCEEIDAWKEEAKFWKDKYEQEIQERNQEWKERHEVTMKGIGNAFRFMLAVKDDENGNMIIDAESRKELGANWEL